MRAAAVVLTYGRVHACQLLACLEHQTRQLPVLLWVDDVPELDVRASSLVHVVHGPRHHASHRIGLVRRAAVEAARSAFALDDCDDAVVLLDDDDHYHRRHFELTLGALGVDAPWTGGLAMGLQQYPGAPVEYLRGNRGVGQHSTWAIRLGAYDAAGGYQDDQLEDVALSLRMGWATCRPHWHCTHVRRHHEANLSGQTVQYDRALQRQRDQLCTVITPSWTPECDDFERFCTAHLLA